MANKPVLGIIDCPELYHCYLPCEFRWTEIDPLA